MDKIKIHRLLIFALVIKFGILVFMGSRPVRTLVWQAILTDDSFYSLQVARNIYRYKSSTFDGYSRTNGYQPLYVWATVPSYGIFGTHTDKPIHAAIVMLAFFSIISAIPLYRLILHLTRKEKLALTGALIWLYFPMLFRQQINGLETSMTGFFLIYSLDIYIREIKNKLPLPEWKSFIKLGVILSLLILARIDQAFLAAGIAIDLLWNQAKTKDNFFNRDFWLKCLGAAIISLLILAPWGIYNITYFGGIIPKSGEATAIIGKKYFMAQASANLPYPTFFLRISTAFVSATFSDWPVHFISSQFKIDLNGVSVALTLAVSFIAVLVLLINSTRKILFSLLKNTSQINISAGFYIISMFLSCSFYIYAPWNFIRYFYPLSLLYACYVTCFFPTLEADFNFSPRLQKIAASLIIFFYLIYSLPLLRVIGKESFWYGRIYDTVAWMNNNLPENAIIGATESGIITYYSKFPVVDLGGKMNPDALEAIKQNRIYQYAKSRGVNYMAGSGLSKSGIMLSDEKPIYENRGFMVCKIK